MPKKAPGRYCLAVCYCGDCDHYQPIRRTQDRDDLAGVAASNDTTAWDKREGSTWIDRL